MQTREKNERTQTQIRSLKNELIRAQTHNFQIESTRFTLIYKNEQNSLQNSFFFLYFFIISKKKIKTTKTTSLFKNTTFVKKYFLKY